MEPISLKSLLLPKSLIRFPNVFGSLDRGCSLTKLLYVKSVPGDESKASLQMAAFHNRNFSEALDWMAARAEEEGLMNTGKKIRVTGVGGEKYATEIGDRLKMEVEFIHEFVGQQTGAHFLLTNFDDDDFCYPESDRKPPTDITELPDWIQRMHQKANEHFAVHDGKRFPAIFGFLGSGVAFNKLNEDLTTEILGVSMLGGKSFLGLSKILVGTNNYTELMSLAEKGWQGNVDTQIKEMFAQGEQAEFKMLPPEMPLFPFGKASECEGDVSFKKEDLAASAIGAFVNSLIPQIALLGKMQRIRRVYIGGHLFSGKPMRDTFDVAMKMAVGMSPLKVRFLSNGHTGCIGCILVSPEESTERKTRMTMG